MRSILSALQDGRLFELPQITKDETLEFLARVLDANPNIEFGADAREEIKKRELECNTGIGMGVAVPHMRTRKSEGELFCAIGWSPTGIDYNASDKAPVHLVLMYYIPDAQKNVYLKEISSLVKAMKKSGGIESIAHASNLSVVRNLLLDWVSELGGESGPDAVARMIKLEIRQSQTPASASPPSPPSSLSTQKFSKAVPFSVLQTSSPHVLILSQDAELVTALEKSQTLETHLTDGLPFVINERQIYVTSSTCYASNRTLYQCIALTV